MNVGALAVLAVAMFLVVMAIRGSQHALFPGLFGPSGTNVPVFNTDPARQTPGWQLPDKNGKCLPGFRLSADGKTCIPPSPRHA